jgi:hypothetical protein
VSLPPVLGPVFFALAFTFVQEPGASAVHQHIQRGGTDAVRQLHPQALLALARGAEIRHLPVQTDHAQQALDSA